MRYIEKSDTIVNRGGSISHLREFDAKHRFYVTKFTCRTPFKIYCGKLLYTSVKQDDVYVAETTKNTSYSKQLDLGQGKRNYFVPRGNNDIIIKYLTDSHDIDKVVRVFYIVDSKTQHKAQRTPSKQKVDVNEVFSVDLKEASDLLTAIKKSVKLDRFMELDPVAKYDIYRTNYPLFATKHPIVLRYLVQASSASRINFNMTAFKKYLQRRTEGANINDCNIYYVTSLFIALNPRYKMNQLREVRTGITKILEEEDKLVKEAKEEGTKQEKRLMDNMDNDYRHELMDYVRENGVPEEEEDDDGSSLSAESMEFDFEARDELMTS